MSANADRRAPRNAEVRLELIGHVEVAVDDRELKAGGHAGRAALEPDLAVVVLGDAPLAAVAAGRLLDDAVRRPARAERVVRAVHPVVERPGQKGFLPLDVAEPPVARVEQLFLVGDAVAVRVGELPDVVRVRFLRQDDARTERCDESREHEVIDEHGVLVVDAVVVRVDVQGNAADGIELARHVQVHHVAAIFDDEHAAVAVEGDGGRLLDDRIGQHELEPIAGLKDELFQFFLGRFRNERRLLRPVETGIDRVIKPAAPRRAPHGPGPGAGRRGGSPGRSRGLPRLRRGCLGWRRSLGDHCETCRDRECKGKPQRARLSSVRFDRHTSPVLSVDA